MVPFIVTLFLDKIVFVILGKIYRRYAAKKGLEMSSELLFNIK